MFRLAWFTALLLGASGCAVLHHVQIGEIDNRGGKKVPFDVMVSETGINLHEAADIARVFSRTRRSDKQLDMVENIVTYTQVGTKTGNPVFVEDYARRLNEAVLEKCPSGRITGLISLRETAKYPVVSGEIVRIKGYCITKG